MDVPLTRLASIPLAVWALLLLAPVSAPLADAQERSDLGELSDVLIEQALADRDALPIELHEVSDPRDRGFRRKQREGVRLRRGVLLTPYTRLAIYGSRILGTPDPEVVKRLAAPELWVVVFPYSRDRARAVLGEETGWRLDPEKKLDGFGVTGGRVFVPEELEVWVRKPTRRTLAPIWQEARGFDYGSWFLDEWIKGRSLAAAFALSDPAIAERTAEIEVTGLTEENARHTFDTWSFPLSRIPEEEWQRALGNTER